MACGIDLYLQVHPNAENLRIENRIGGRPKVLRPEEGHLGLLESLCCSGCKSRDTMFTELDEIHQ